MSFVRDAAHMLDLERRIRRTSEALERLKTGALVALTGGTTVLGLVGGGVFWVPTAMAGSLLAFRVLEFVAGIPRWRHEQRLKRWDAVRARLRKLQEDNLPAESAKALAEPLEAELTLILPRRMLPLLATSSKTDKAHNNMVERPGPGRAGRSP